MSPESPRHITDKLSVALTAGKCVASRVTDQQRPHNSRLFLDSADFVPLFPPIVASPLLPPPIDKCDDPGSTTVRPNPKSQTWGHDNTQRINLDLTLGRPTKNSLQQVKSFPNNATSL